MKKWAEFIGEDRRPTETDYFQYFDNLHTMKNLKASTIWLTCSSLNKSYTPASVRREGLSGGNAVTENL